MRGAFDRIYSICHYLGRLMQVLALVMLLPMIAACWDWRQHGEGWHTVLGFAWAALVSGVIGTAFRYFFDGGKLDKAGALLLCSLSWIVAVAVGALPFIWSLDMPLLDAYFESVSGFTTTGFTVLLERDTLPMSILFWRCLTQWIGGLGILSLFLVMTLWSPGSHHVFGAESHKIAYTRPVPGLINTVIILWSIYVGFTLLAAAIFALQGMTGFDAICHSLTTLSTGGFSTHDANLAYFREAGYRHYRLIEYTVIFFMIVGGINFLVHYRLLRLDFKALWDHIEIRVWWGMILVLTVLVALDHVTHGASRPDPDAPMWEQTLRLSLFQVTSLMTSTGFTSQNIMSDYFGALSHQLFLLMMFVGGCVGSTSGGFKVLRVVILNRLIRGEIFRMRVSDRAVSGVIIDGKKVPEVEIDRIAGLLFGWILLLIIGGGVTAWFTELDPWAAYSGMFSAMGNMGPCYISIPEMAAIHPVVKVTLIVGMLAGRLEILPLLLVFSRKAWV